MKEYSVEELENILDSEEESPAKELDSSVLNYIKENKIEPGRTPVANYIIYHHYCRKWNLQGKKLSYIQFFREFNKMYNQRRTGKTRYYMLEHGVYPIDKEAVENAKRYREKKLKKS